VNDTQSSQRPSTGRLQLGGDSQPQIELGSQLALDGSFLGTFIDRVQFVMPTGIQEVSAIGTIDVGRMRFIRYYFLDRDAFLETEFRAGVLASCRLFVRDMEEFPTDERQWHAWTGPGDGRLGSPSLLHGDYEYKRLWNGSPSWVSPISIVEHILVTHSDDPVRVEKLTMMYYRIDSPPLGAAERTFRELLILMVDAISVETYLGLDYDVSRLEVQPPSRAYPHPPD
jgi:hypothetical protein